MNEWVSVDVNEINKEVKRDIFGVGMKLSFSPYDVPQRVRSYRDLDGNVFIIEFEYLLDEQTHSKKLSEDSAIELEIGNNSQRIYKIKLDIPKLGDHAASDPLAKCIVQTIEQFKKTVPQRLQERYKMPENVVLKNREQLLSPLA